MFTTGLTIPSIIQEDAFGQNSLLLLPAHKSSEIDSSWQKVSSDLINILFFFSLKAPQDIFPSSFSLVHAVNSGTFESHNLPILNNSWFPALSQNHEMKLQKNYGCIVETSNSLDTNSLTRSRSYDYSNPRCNHGTSFTGTHIERK